MVAVERETGPIAALFRNRAEAGRMLARKFAEFTGRSDVLVLSLPHGGLQVGYALARALELPFDVFDVRRLSVPGHHEIAMGAVATGGVCVVDDAVVHAHRVTENVVAETVRRERADLEWHEAVHRGRRPAPSVRDCVVLLADDGLASTATLEAAATALWSLGPARVFLASPTAISVFDDSAPNGANANGHPSARQELYADGRVYGDFYRILGLVMRHTSGFDDPDDPRDFCGRPFPHSQRHIRYAGLSTALAVALARGAA
jgi:putative phosphoribosyl transferase